jgi:LuxR family maltose regulon positive regulatory protein
MSVPVGVTLRNGKMSIGVAVFNPKLLVPHCSPKVIRRERLIDLLHNNIQSRFQVLTAPAGFGKTTLLAQFTQDINAPVCWYSLEPADEDPDVLLEGIISSIASRFNRFGQQSFTRLLNTDAVIEKTQLAVNSLVAEIRSEVKDFFIIVIDDFHLIQSSKPAKHLLNLLIEKLPDNCHVIISSRTPVEIPVIIKNLPENPECLINGIQIALTSPETKELIAMRCGTNLTTQEAEKLTRHTGGWMLGVLSGAAKMREHKLWQNDITCDDISDYLTSELYNNQPPKVKNFLLATSTLDDLSPELCNQLLSIVDSRKILRQLYKQNFFMHCINEDKRWYRYHQIFKDFLQNKLMEDDPLGFLELHQLAGSVYEQNHQWDLAIKHYSMAKKTFEVTEILKKVGQEFFKAGKWTTVSKWLDILSPELLNSNPELMLLNAQTVVYTGRSDEAVHILSKLIDKLAADEDWLMKVKALSWRSAAFRLNGYFDEARIDIGKAIRLLELYKGPADLLGDAHRRLGNIHAEQGRFPQALKHFQRALKYFTTILDVGEISRTHNSLGIVYKRLGNLPQAKMHFEKARSGWLKTNNFGALAVVLNNIGIIYQRIGQYDLALETLRYGLEKARSTGYRRVEAGTLISIADILRDLGQYDDALNSYQDGLNIAREVMESSLVAYATAGIGETYQRRGDREKADILLKEAYHQAEEQLQPYEAALFSIPLGISEYEQGRFEKANKILTTASLQLEKMGDKDALARTYFHLAQNSFLSKQYDQAINWLKQVSSLADELGYEDFLITEGKNAVPLIQYGSEREAGGTRFARVLEKIGCIREKKSALETAVGSSAGLEMKIKPDIEVKALGQTIVKINNRRIDDVEWRSQRAKEIFFYLLNYRNGKTREQIAEALWPELSPAKASSNFHINVFRARQALYPGIFVFENGCYKINPSLNISFDVAEFEKLLKGTESSPCQIVSLIPDIEAALGLYGGTFLKELNNEWIEIRRRELENQYIKALSLLVNFFEKKAEYGKATAFLEKLIAVDPYDEDAFYRIMRFHLADRNSPMALYAYRRYAEIVSNCAESETADIRKLQQRILTSASVIPQKN